MWQRGRLQPIGLDIGRRAIKAAQVEHNGAGLRVVGFARAVLPADMPADPAAREPVVIRVLSDLMGSGRFRGRKVVTCLGGDELFVQNLRVPKVAEQELDSMIRWEAEERVPFGGAAAEIRYMIAGDVRHGDELRREVILLATQREHIERKLRLLEAARLQVQAIDAHPCAVFRWFQNFLRRKSDAERVNLYVDVGAGSTKVIIARGTDIIFVKDIAIGGETFDAGVARKLDMPLAEAAALRRRLLGTATAGRRDDDRVVMRTLLDALRPDVDNLGREIALCVRYSNVTFRGPKVEAAFFCGGEASATLIEMIGESLDVPAKPADPRQGVEDAPDDPPLGGDAIVALGLSLR